MAPGERYTRGSADRSLRYPITGIVGRCPRAVRGHAAALPSSVMNSRRFTLDPICSIATSFSC
jgi:hypothetical protein